MPLTSSSPRVTSICLQATNYLNIEDLPDLGCTAVAGKMMGKTPEEIPSPCIESNCTPEQESEVRRENAWAFKDGWMDGYINESVKALWMFWCEILMDEW